MLQYPSDLPDDEYSKKETAQNIDDQDGDEDESDDDPISILDKFMHVMKSVASRADAEKASKKILWKMMKVPGVIQMILESKLLEKTRLRIPEPEIHTNKKNINTGKKV